MTTCPERRKPRPSHKARAREMKHVKKTISKYQAYLALSSKKKVCAIDKNSIEEVKGLPYQNLWKSKRRHQKDSL